MKIKLYTLVHGVPMDQRRLVSPTIFRALDDRGFVEVEEVPWDAKLDSLPPEPALIDATFYAEYPHPADWPGGYPDLTKACAPFGHVAFNRDGVLISDVPGKWFDKDKQTEHIDRLVNRVRGNAPAF